MKKKATVSEIHKIAIETANKYRSKRKKLAEETMRELYRRFMKAKIQRWEHHKRGGYTKTAEWILADNMLRRLATSDYEFAIMSMGMGLSKREIMKP